MIRLKQLLTEALEWKQCKGWNSTGESYWDGTNDRPKIVINKSTTEFKLTYTGKLAGFYISSANRGAKDSVHQAFNVMACECNNFLNSNPGIKPNIDNIKTSCTYDSNTKYTLQIIIPFVKVGYGKWQINRRGSWGGTPDISTLPVASDYYEFYPVDKKYVTNITKIPGSEGFGNITEYFVTYNLDTPSAITHKNTNKSTTTNDKNKDKNKDNKQTDDNKSNKEPKKQGNRMITTYSALKDSGFIAYDLDVKEDDLFYKDSMIRSEAKSTEEEAKKDLLTRAAAKNIDVTDKTKGRLFKKALANNIVVLWMEYSIKDLETAIITRPKPKPDPEPEIPQFEQTTWENYVNEGWYQFNYDTNKIDPSTVVKPTKIYVSTTPGMPADYDISVAYYNKLKEKKWSEREIRKAGGHLIGRNQDGIREMLVVFEQLENYIPKQQIYLT